MAHPQNSPRGLWHKNAFKVSGDGILFTPYSETTALLDSNSTGLTVAGQVRLGATYYITANTTGVTTSATQLRIGASKYIGTNSTGWTFTAAAAKPTTRSAAKIAFLTNGTGVNAVMVNTTGTTWKYLNVTTILPT